MINVSDKNVLKLSVGDKKALKIYIADKEVPMLINWYRYELSILQVTGEIKEISFAELGTIKVHRTDSLLYNDDLTFTSTSAALILDTLEKWQSYVNNDTWRYTLLSESIVYNSPFVYKTIEYDQTIDSGTARKFTLTRVPNKSTELIITDSEDAHTEGWDGEYFWYKTPQV